MAAPRLERAPHRGAAFALSNASKRARIRSIGSRSGGSLFIFRSSPAAAPPGPKGVHCSLARVQGVHCSFFDHPPPPLPLAPGYRVARDHGLPALRDVHLLVNVLHSDVLVSPGSLALLREQALLIR